MTISRLITAVFEPRSGTETNRSIPLRIGSLLRGEVLEVRPDGRALIEFGQARVLAEVHFQVKPGTLICARVESTGKPLRLTHIPQPPDQLSRNKPVPPPYSLRQEAAMKRLPDLIDRVLGEVGNRGSAGKPLPETVRQALMAIRHYCLPLDLSNQTESISRQLKQWIENSGAYFEQRLARLLTDMPVNAQTSSTRWSTGHADVDELVRSDLKANLFKLKDFLDRGGQKECLPGLFPKDLDELKTTMGLLLEEIEDRLRTVIKNRDAEHFLFSHLLNLTPGDHRGLLQVKVPVHRQKSSDTDVRLSLLLQMDRLGNIRSDLWLSASGLRVTIVVSDAGVKHLVDNNIRNLEALLHRHFRTLSIDVRVADPVGTDIETEGRSAVVFFHQRTIDTNV